MVKKLTDSKLGKGLFVADLFLLVPSSQGLGELVQVACLGAEVSPEGGLLQSAEGVGVRNPLRSKPPGELILPTFTQNLGEEAVAAELEFLTFVHHHNDGDVLTGAAAQLLTPELAQNELYQQRLLTLGNDLAEIQHGDAGGIQIPMVADLGTVNGAAQVFKAGQGDVDPFAAVLLQVSFCPTKKTLDGLGVFFSVGKLMDGGHKINGLDVLQLVCHLHDVS